ncbi:hypothetical protein NIES4071_29060 [Calothrix sp. NIES-4071]|nr:hypothetical protein NIES4071_29060 [Calothrix sp. NIES-4071]BAZ57227.1 hypothetical protein NIES4105_29000 [Calothrix sp. NIES-4105]
MSNFKKNQGLIKSTTLLLIAFATVFLSRLLETAGFPAIINFAHFATVPFASAQAIFKTRTKNYNQISISKALLSSLIILLGVITASALVNRAGVINVILQFLLLFEPFMFLLAIICLPMAQTSFTRLRKWFIRFSCFHIFLALFQQLLLSVGILKLTTMLVPADNIQGVFYLSGSGHVVGASVSISFGIYYLISEKKSPMWLRVSIFFAAFLQLLFADAKQVLLVCLVSWFLLILMNVKDVGKTIQYVIAAILVVWILIWCTQNLELFRAFNTWNRPEIYGPNGEATLLKTASIRLIISHYKSPLNWLFGLGPGHTVGRLGGWMLPKYSGLLAPLGATIHPVSQETWDAVSASWLGPASSMFSPLFGWAGIWGDSGLLGLGAYLYILFIVWHRLCLDNFSKFLILNVVVNGFIFSQMEEPAYMLFVTGLIGLQWQERRIAKAFKERSLYVNADHNHSLEPG